MNKLNTKQQKFIYEYLIDFNATKAAIRSGYSAHTARQIGQKLLTNVDIKREIDVEMFKIHDSQKKRLALASEKAIDALLEVLETGTNYAKVSAANSILDRAGHVFTNKMVDEFNSMPVYEQSEESREDALNKFIESLNDAAVKLNLN